MIANPPSEAPARATVDRALTLIMFVLVAYRLAYHASYLGEVPFAHATFSDGAVYEQSARDILEHPPLGSQAFYLQGLYAYLLALGMAVKPWPSLGLLVQLLVSFATLWLFHRQARALWGQRAGAVSTILLLAHPGLLFYENKYVSAELGIACNVVALAGFVALLRVGFGDQAPARARARLGACLLLGLGAGLSILGRPNMMLALPCSLLAIVALGRGQQASKRAIAASVAVASLGAALALAPMAARNLAVTGHADIQPVHGGGTSFFIGNNQKSRGLWNDGDLLSARLGTESDELALALHIDRELPEREQARAIGRALYRRSLSWIAEHPAAFAELEARKLWLTLGDQQLTQDYDWLGERELLPWAHRVGVSFSMLLALGLIGAWVVLGGGRVPPSMPTERAAGHTRALAWFLGGQIGATLAANLLFFTSAQHRLPLVIPLALLSGPGLLALAQALRSRWTTKKGSLPESCPPGVATDEAFMLHGSRLRRGPATQPLPTWLTILAVLALVQGPWSRSPRSGPHPVHYYNLAMVQDSIGEPREALASIDKAIALRPEQAIFHMRRAHLRVRLFDLDGAEADLLVVARLAQAGSVPGWVLDQAELDRRTIAYERALASHGAAPGRTHTGVP